MRSLIAMLAACFCVSALAFDHEPSGFRGIAWRTPVSKLPPDMKRIERDGPSEVFIRLGEHMSIGASTLHSVWYLFYKGEFEGALVRTENGDRNKEALRAAMVARFGTPVQPNPLLDRSFWIGRSARLSLDCALQPYCTAFFQSVAVAAKETQDKAAAARAARKDF